MVLTRSLTIGSVILIGCATPPISLVGDVLNHLKLCNGRGVLLVPMWQSSYFWPLLTPNGIYFYEFVKDYLLLDPYFYNYTARKTVFEGFAKFKSLALLVEFNTD